VSASLSADGRTLATANADGSIGAWSVRANKAGLLIPAQPNETLTRVALNGDGTRLAAANTMGKARIYELDISRLRRSACAEEKRIRQGPESKYLSDCPRYLSESECAITCAAGR